MYVIFLTGNGTVVSYTKIANSTGGLTLSVPAASYFSFAAGNIGDLNNDGFTDLAVGALGLDTY